MKKTITRIAAACLALVLCFGLVACGSSSSTGTTATTATTAAATTTGSDAPAETTATETDWPKKDITIVVPFSAGGDTDFHARLLAQYASQKLGVNVIVENVSGANGSQGMMQVLDSDPDGYTALFFHDSMLTNNLVGTCEYNYTDLKLCAATIADNSYVLAVNKNSWWTTLQDVVDAAKAKPGDLLYASSVGGYSYYLGRKFEVENDVDFNIVDAGGGTDRNAALLAGTIDTNCNPYGVMKSYFDSGDFIAVATLAEERNPLFPDVPTAKEQGYDWVAERHYFLSFPKDTDDAIVAKMESVIREICADPEFIAATEAAYCVTPTFIGSTDLKATLDEYFADFSSHMDLING